MTANKLVASDQIKIEIMSEDDRDAALQFLRVNFFKDEPLNKCLGIISEQTPICEDMENYEMQELKHGLSLKAVEDGKIVGLCTNYIIERGYENKQDDFVVTDEKFSKVIAFLDYIAKNSNIFQHFPDCDKAIYAKIISVDESYRQYGIAGKLIAATLDVARQHGCGFMVADCTNHFSVLALQKFGFKVIWQLNFSDYKADGKVVFAIPPPHDSLRVLAQRIPSKL